MNLLILISIGFLTTIACIFFSRPLAIKLKLIDYPDSRKQHKGEIPLTGGISIFVGMVVSLIYINEVNTTIYIILIFSFLILMLGIYDDVINLKPKIKLYTQLFLVATTIYLSGIKIEGLGFLFGLPYPLDLGLLTIPFSIISVVGLINAFNMVDGLDGQAGLLSVIAILGIFIFGLDKVGPDLYEILLIIFSALIGFLIFNISSNIKIKIFLGDGGSLFLGFIISFSLIYCTQILKLFSPSFALWCVAIPLYDFFATIIIRAVKKHSLMKAGKDHLHHALQNTGFSKFKILVLTAFIGLFLLIVGKFIEDNFPRLSFPIFMISFLFYLYLRIYILPKKKI